MSQTFTLGLIHLQEHTPNVKKDFKPPNKNALGYVIDEEKEWCRNYARTGGFLYQKIKATQKMRVAMSDLRKPVRESRLLPTVLRIHKGLPPIHKWR